MLGCYSSIVFAEETVSAAGSAASATSNAVTGAAVSVENAAAPQSETAAPTAVTETPVAPTTTGANTSAIPSSQLTAPRVRYSGSSIIAEGGVVYQSGESTVRAQRLQIDTATGDITAIGEVMVERLTQSQRRLMTPKDLPKRTTTEPFLETLRGENLTYNARTRRSKVDKAELRLSNFSLNTANIIINGQRYEARDVILRPGALTEAEEKIYGRPPFSLRADLVTVESGVKGGGATEISDSASPGSPGAGGRSQTASRGSVRVAAKGAALYYKNTKILPVPSYALRQATAGAGSRDDAAYQLTPRFSFNSTDRLLLTTKLRFPISKDPLGPAVLADLGLSARIGVRGGATLQYPTQFGSFTLRGRKNDIVTTQLTNRIVLDRLPEVIYSLPTVPLLNLPGGRRARLDIDLGTGRFNERTVGGGGGEIRANRSALNLVATTRSNDKDGPYVELFAATSRYSNFAPHYRTTGYEVGYYGSITKRVRGLFSYRATDVNGSTPFRFDRVEIARELRSTFDVMVTPRWLIPVDLRYDLDQGRLRDERFGLLRNYKSFAYGVTYQTARRELKLEVRQGF